MSGTCSAANQTACFQSGGVVGRIPADRLYGLGMNILKMYPMPNVTDARLGLQLPNHAPGRVAPGDQPAVRLDYQPYQNLRGTFKYSGWSQEDVQIPGTIPGFNDTRQYNPFVRTFAATVNYSVNSSTFLEATYGRAQNSLTGCALAQANTGPTFCRNAFPVNDIANANNAGLAGLPRFFPNAGVINPNYFAFEALQGVKPVIWDGTRISMPPSFAWGNLIANAPPNTPFPGYLNVNKTNDFSISLTKVTGRHTLKGGFYNTHSFKAQQRQGWAGTITFGNDASNPLDTGFGFSNAALGVFSSFNQFSQYVEGQFVYNNTEGYVQDNWKVTNKLTLDYGVRFVHQQPQYDQLGAASNFLPGEFAIGAAPVLYGAGCAGAALHRREPAGPRSADRCAARSQHGGGDRHARAQLRQYDQRVVPVGPGHRGHDLHLAEVQPAPRFGVAYDITGNQNLVLRGGGGLFFDRPAGNSIFAQVQNPPTIRNLTVRYTDLQSLSSGLTTEAPPTLRSSVRERPPVHLAVERRHPDVLPWATALDVGHRPARLQPGRERRLNGVDFGAAYQAVNQDPTLLGATPGAAAVPADQMRAFRGFSTITQAAARGCRDVPHAAALAEPPLPQRLLVRLQRDDRSVVTRAARRPAAAQRRTAATPSATDQAQADELLGNFIAGRHTYEGNFVWALPDHSDRRPSKALG